MTLLGNVISFYLFSIYFLKASLIAQLVKNLPAMQETPVWSLGWEDPLEKIGFPLQSTWASLCGSAGIQSARNAGDLSLIPGLGRSPGEGKGYPLQYSGLENSMDCVVHGVTKSWTILSHFHFHYFLIFPTLIWATDHATRLYLHLVVRFGRKSLEIDNAK